MAVTINHEIKLKEQVELESLQQLMELTVDIGANSVEEMLQIRILPYEDSIFRSESVYHWGIKLPCFWPWCRIWIYLCEVHTR